MAADECGGRRGTSGQLEAPWDVEVVRGGEHTIDAENRDVQDVAGHFPNRRP